MSSNSKFSLILSEIRQSVHLSFPLVVTSIVQSSSSFFVTLMLAHVGKDELASMGLVWVMYVTAVVFFMGILSAISVLIAQQRGAKNEGDVSIIFSQSVWLSIMLTIPVMILFWASPLVLRWSGQDQHVVHLATQILYALSWSMLPLAFIMVMEQFLIGLEKTRLVLFINLIQIPCEVFVNYVFIFGKYGMPKLGVAGFGYGFTLVFTLAVIVIALSLAHSSLGKRYQVFSHFWMIHKHYLLELLRVGFPIGAMLVIEVAFGATFAFMMGNLGVDVLAGHQIVMQYWNLTMGICFGIAEATGVRVGYEAGANNREGMQRAYRVNIGIGLFCMLLVAFYYIAFPTSMIALDVNIHLAKYAGVVHFATIFFAICAVDQLFDTMRWIAIGALRGLKDTTYPMLISGFIFWFLALPLGYWLEHARHMGGAGLWWGMVFASVTGAVILMWRFYRREKTVDLKALVQRQ